MAQLVNSVWNSKDKRKGWRQANLRLKKLEGCVSEMVQADQEKVMGLQVVELGEEMR